MERYKAKLIDNPENSIYGQLIQEEAEGRFYIIANFHIEDDSLKGIIGEINPETLQKETIYCDKNRRRLFENDVVLFHSPNGRKYFCRICEVQGGSYELVSAFGSAPFHPDYVEVVDTVYKITRIGMGAIQTLTIVRQSPSLMDIVGANAYLTLRDAENALRIKRVSELL